MKDNSKDSKDGGPAGPGPDAHHEQVTPAQYVRAAKTHLTKGNNKEAYAVLQAAIADFPEEPLILSYFGYLQALVDKKYRSGIETCKSALTMKKEKSAEDEEESFTPTLYLNLGRAFLSAGKKEDAINAFTKGLKFDRSNSEILKEMRKLGKRKAPPLSFLDRANPINRLLGMVLNRGKEEPERKKK